jgi:hypothetical protein
MEYTEKEFALAKRVVELEDCLKIANENASKMGMMGVLASRHNPSFRKARAYYARVRKVIRETY